MAYNSELYEKFRFSVENFLKVAHLEGSVQTFIHYEWQRIIGNTDSQTNISSDVWHKVEQYLVREGLFFRYLELFKETKEDYNKNLSLNK